MAKKKKSIPKGATKATPKRGSRARREQRRKPPEKAARQTTRADWRPVVLEELGKTANIMVACLKAGIDRVTFYRERNRNQKFARAARRALADAVDWLELEARRRALQGVEKPVFHKGEVCGHIREYSDRLMMFLLEAHRPDKFRRNLKLEHTGKDGGPVIFSFEDAVKGDKELEDWERGRTADNSSTTDAANASAANATTPDGASGASQTPAAGQDGTGAPSAGGA